MSPEVVIQHFGSVAATAKALGIKSPSVSEWKQRGRVPETRQYQVEVLTHGELRAERQQEDAHA